MLRRWCRSPTPLRHSKLTRIVLGATRMSIQLNPYFIRSTDNSANRDTARAISLSVIAQVMPDQVDDSLFIVEPLIDRAARGQLVRAGSDEAFGLGGSDLIILVVVPIVVSLLTNTFKAAAVANIEALRGHLISPSSVSEDEVRRILKHTDVKVDGKRIASLTVAINTLVSVWFGERSLPTLGIVTALPEE